MVLKATENAFPKEAFQETVQAFPSKSEGVGGLYTGPLTLYFASFADALPEWGIGPLNKNRDKELRTFWQKETMLAGAMNAVCQQRAGYKWKVEGPQLTVDAITRMLHGAIVGNQRGWIPFVMALSQDLLSTDNGAFIEIIRRDNGNPLSPVIGIGHLDSLACYRTGNPETPVHYMDIDGKTHKMPWWSIIPLSELTSPDQRLRGLGFCAVSRVIRYAQLLRNIAIYKNEKVSGRFVKAIHFVGGVSRQEITDIMARGEEEADNRGQTRYIMPQIIASLDPEKPISTATIDLAALPDNFDLDEELKWYITGLAMGFGVDYQDFAPLPGGNLGTSTQSEVLHRKSSAKAPAVFMQTIENIFHFYGVLPKNVTFSFDEKDLAAELQQMQIRKERIETRAIQIRSGEISPQAAREIAVRDGDLESDIASKIPDNYGMELAQKPPDRAFSNGSQRDTIRRRVRQEVKEEFD